MLERLLDSVILIDHFNNISMASTFIAGLNPAKTGISVISYADPYELKHVGRIKQTL